MKRMLFVVGIMLAVGLVGCTGNTKPDANYQLQLEMVQKMHEASIAQEQQRDSWNKQILLACGSDKDCVKEVGWANAVNTLAQKAGNGGGSNAPSIPSYQRRESFWEKAGLTLVGGLIPGYSSIRQSDNMTKVNIEQIRATSQQTTALYGMLDNYVQNVQPNITITGRDGAGIGNTYTYNSADTNTTGDGNAVGDNSRADNSRGQVNGDGNFNSGRIGSAGPWENSNNGGNCPGGNGGDGGGAPGGGAGGTGADGGDCSGGG